MITHMGIPPVMTMPTTMIMTIIMIGPRVPTTTASGRVTTFF